jgi:hypothetical protein
VTKKSQRVAIVNNEINIICNIRGTNGSGKTTAVTQLIRYLRGSTMLDEKGKIWAYNLQNRIYVLGRYETPTGGCDGIRTQEAIYAGIRTLAALGNVVFEGFLISGMYARYRELEEELKPTHHWIWACLDTPLEKCIEQTVKRRAEKGNTKEFNPANLGAKFRAVVTTRVTLENEGRDVRTLPHQHTLASLLDWFLERVERTPEVAQVA